MENTQYYKDGVAKVLDLMKDTFGDYFKAYFNGQPPNLPEFLLPCLMVVEGAGEITSGATGTDRIVETVTIIIALNKKDDIGATQDTDLTDFKIRKLVKGQDPTTQEYHRRSVMYALRTYITMDNTVLENRVETEFGENVRVNGEGNDLATMEGFVQLQLRRQAIVPSRT